MLLHPASLAERRSDLLVLRQNFASTLLSFEMPVPVWPQDVYSIRCMCLYLHLYFVFWNTKCGRLGLLYTLAKIYEVQGTSQNMSWMSSSLYNSPHLHISLNDIRSKPAIHAFLYISWILRSANLSNTAFEIFCSVIFQMERGANSRQDVVKVKLEQASSASGNADNAFMLCLWKCDLQKWEMRHLRQDSNLKSIAKNPLMHIS